MTTNNQTRLTFIIHMTTVLLFGTYGGWLLGAACVIGAWSVFVAGRVHGLRESNRPQLARVVTRKEANRLNTND